MSLFTFGIVIAGTKKRSSWDKSILLLRPVTALTDDSVSIQNQRKTSEAIRHVTYKRLDSLEETIRELERALIEISIHPTAEQLYTDTASKSSTVQMPDGQTTGTKKPPVPPKPSSLGPASTQVHDLHLLCRCSMSSFPSLLLLSG